MDKQLINQELKRLSIVVESGEEVFEIIYKHWGRVILPLIGLIIIVTITTLGIIFYLIAADYSIGNFLLFTSAVGFWYLALVLYGISEWYGYRHSTLIITNQRLIDCQQLTIFTRRVQTIDIYEIQSCTGEVAGSAGTLFNYGDLLINTLGDRPVAVHFVPSPELVSNQVMHYHHMSAHGVEKPDEKSIENVITILSFHIPSENLAETLKDLPAQKEPTITYLPKTDFYELEIAVPSEQVPNIVSMIKAKGAIDIISQVSKSLE